MTEPRDSRRRVATRQNEAPSVGGDAFFHDMLPSAPAVTGADLRNAGLALVHTALREAGLPYSPSRTRLSDLTVNQADGLATALMALGVKRSPVPEWYRDPITRTVKRTTQTEATA